MLFGGNGETEFYESKGNFRIEDYVTSRIPLTKVQVVSGGSGPPTQVKLSATSNDQQYVSKIMISAYNIQVAFHG